MIEILLEDKLSELFDIDLLFNVIVKKSDFNVYLLYVLIFDDS